MQLFPMQKLVGLGKHLFGTHPTTQPVKISDIGWLASAICCQIYGKTLATAPILASCTYYSILEEEEIINEVLGYNPYSNLSDLHKAVVEYCVSLALLHELDREVNQGNYYCLTALEKAAAKMNHWNKEVERLTTTEQTEKKVEKRKKYKH